MIFAPKIYQILEADLKLEAGVLSCSLKYHKFHRKAPAMEPIFEKVAERPATLFKKRFQHWCFPVKFAKFLRTRFFTEHLRWLLLTSQS